MKDTSKMKTLTCDHEDRLLSPNGRLDVRVGLGPQSLDLAAWKRNGRLIFMLETDAHHTAPLPGHASTHVI